MRALEKMTTTVLRHMFTFDLQSQSRFYVLAHWPAALLRPCVAAVRAASLVIESVVTTMHFARQGRASDG